MGQRYDYRIEYKGLSLEQLNYQIQKQKNNILKNIGIDDKALSENIKRLSYLENKVGRQR